MTKQYLEMERDSINEVKPKNVLILLSEFAVGDLGGSGLEPKMTFEN